MEIKIENVAWHLDPVLESDFFVRADLSTFGMPDRYEQLWVKQLGDCKFELRCIPFFTYGLALGDIIETDEDFTIRRLISRGPNNTMRVAIVNKGRILDFHPILHSWLANLRLSHEWYSKGFVSIAYPNSVNGQPDIGPLEKLRDEGELAIEFDESAKFTAAS